MTDTEDWSKMSPAEHMQAAQHIVENMYSPALDVQVAVCHLLAALVVQQQAIHLPYVNVGGNTTNNES